MSETRSNRFDTRHWRLLDARISSVMAAFSDSAVGDDAVKRAMINGVHAQVGIYVVPDSSQRLLECPRFAAFPLQFVAMQLIAEDCARTILEKMPACHDVQCGVGWTEATTIEYADQPAS